MNQGKLKTSESEVYNAIQQRILEQDPKIADQKPEALEKLPEDLKTAIGKLLPFADQAPVEPERVIPYEIKDHLELVDWSGRAVVEGKRGSIPENLPPILERLKIDPSALLSFLSRKDQFHHVIGSKTSIREGAIKLRKRFLQGIAAAERLFPQRI